MESSWLSFSLLLLSLCSPSSVGSHPTIRTLSTRLVRYGSGTIQRAKVRSKHWTLTIGDPSNYRCSVNGWIQCPPPPPITNINHPLRTHAGPLASSLQPAHATSGSHYPRVPTSIRLHSASASGLPPSRLASCPLDGAPPLLRLLRSRLSHLALPCPNPPRFVHAADFCYSIFAPVDASRLPNSILSCSHVPRASSPSASPQ